MTSGDSSACRLCSNAERASPQAPRPIASIPASTGAEDCGVSCVSKYPRSFRMAIRMLPFRQTPGKSQAVRFGWIRSGPGALLSGDQSYIRTRREREALERARIRVVGGMPTYSSTRKYRSMCVSLRA